MCALPYLYRRSCQSPCTCCGWLWQKESPSALGWKAPQTASGSGNKTDQLIIVFNLLIRCLADKEAQRGYSPPGCPVCSWCHRLKPGTSGRGTWPVGCSPSSWSAGALWPASRSSLASAGCRCLPSTCRGRHMHKNEYMRHHMNPAKKQSYNPSKDFHPKKKKPHKKHCCSHLLFSFNTLTEGMEVLLYQFYFNSNVIIIIWNSPFKLKKNLCRSWRSFTHVPH